MALAARPVANALIPSEPIHPLVPKPKKAWLDYGHPLRIHDSLQMRPNDLARSRLWSAVLARRFADPRNKPGDRDWTTLTVQVEPSLRPGGYRLRVTPRGVVVQANDELTTRFALERLASMAFAKNGSLWLPTGTLDDWPSSPWRGVHLFTGPRSLAFHKRLWERVLLPLGFNKVVIECEQTDWKATPGIQGPITTTRADLARLFRLYRTLGVEPIPLIQSFGHMAWLFQNGRNIDLALDPAAKWAIDPRKPQAKQLISDIWDEAIELLHPQTVHFGLDEVGLRGSPGESPLLTQLLKTQLGLLAGIARRHHVRPMLWGDQALGPGEAIDYALAGTPAVAADRRKAIPKGAIIGDWHYADRNDPDAFGRSLDLWKRGGFTPIAAAWYQPENVRAFNIAAATRGLGTLQTTWAGYESSEENLLGSNYRQFTAMVLAAEYAWSGRTDPIDKLGYDPAAVFRQMYFAPPRSVAPRPGTLYGDGPSMRIGEILYSRLDSPKLRCGGSPVHLRLGGQGSELAVALTTSDRLKVGTNMAEIAVELESGKVVTQSIRYGLELRTPDDRDSCPLADRAHGVSSVRIPLGPGPARIMRLTVRPMTDLGAVSIMGVTTY